MSTLDISNLIAQVQVKVVDGAYQAAFNGRHFRIQPRMYEALGVLQEDGVDAGSERLMERWGIAPESRSAFKTELLEQVARLAPERASTSYIQASVTVLPASLVQRLSVHLALLFRRPVVWTVCLLALLVLGDLFLFHQVGGTQLRSLDLSGRDLLMGYLCVLAVLLFHELGHAAGMRHVGQPPHEIGFGFYLIFPVFFANVSNAWLVDRHSRFVVNLGGIYFQLLASVILYIGIALTEGHTQAWLSLAFKSNLATALFVLIPFIRNDGYWLLADFLGLHDLYQRAGGMCWIVYRKLREKAAISGTEWFIAVYAVCNYSFLGFVCYGLLNSSYRNFSQTLEILVHHSWEFLALEHPRLLVSSTISLVVLFFFTRPFLLRAYTHVKSRFQTT